MYNTGLQRLPMYDLPLRLQSNRSSGSDFRDLISYDSSRTHTPTVLHSAGVFTRTRLHGTNTRAPYLRRMMSFGIIKREIAEKRAGRHTPLIDESK